MSVLRKKLPEPDWMPEETEKKYIITCEYCHLIGDPITQYCQGCGARFNAEKLTEIMVNDFTFFTRSYEWQKEHYPAFSEYATTYLPDARDILW